MSHLILVRHAQPVIDPDSPSERWTLAQPGRDAAAELARALTSYAPRTVLCGDEPKMIGTAEILSETFGAALRCEPGQSSERSDVSGHRRISWRERSSAMRSN